MSLADINLGITSKLLTVSLSVFREWLGVNPKKYVRFNNFRQTVLKIAQKELLEKTDLKFSFTTLCKGRKVEGLKFLVQVNKANAVDSEFESVLVTSQKCCDQEMLNQLQSAVPTLPDGQAVLLVNSYSREVLTESLLGLLIAISANQIKTTPAQYLIGILKNKKVQHCDGDVQSERKTMVDKLTDRSWDVESLDF